MIPRATGVTNVRIRDTYVCAHVLESGRLVIREDLLGSVLGIDLHELARRMSAAAAKPERFMRAVDGQVITGLDVEAARQILGGAHAAA